ncbi:hypothetical protein H9P43_004224 [Blastocladiella emersonii ATCC 22665]|nr:hypothetical protein H9P43_004138 [Blastocladiella emersonii ATCC 22665]KAI9183307.1 hypothetical protein H9P43_004224 [Blastocladiella emersonii ATCC 22665]
MSASIALAAPVSPSSKSPVSSVKHSLRVVVAPANGTSSCNVPGNKVADNECAVDSTPTPTVGTLKDRFEQLASAPSSPAGTSPRSACSRSSDQVHVVKFIGDNGHFVQGDDTIKSKSAPAGPATAAAVVLGTLAGVHVATLRASFEPTTVAVAAVAPVTPATDVPAAVDTLASTAAPIKEIVSCPVPVAAAPTAEKKRSAAGKVLRWVRRRAGHRGSASPAAVDPEVKVVVAAEAVEANVANVVGSNLAVLSAALGSDQTLVDNHESTSRWSSFKARIGSLLGGASSTVKASAVSSESKPHPIKRGGVKVLPTTPSPVVVLRSAALVS